MVPKLKNVFRLVEATEKRRLSPEVMDAVHKSMNQGMDPDRKPEWRRFFDQVGRGSASGQPADCDVPDDQEFYDEISDAVDSEVYDPRNGNDYGNDYGVDQEEVFDQLFDVDKIGRDGAPRTPDFEDL